MKLARIILTISMVFFSSLFPIALQGGPLDFGNVEEGKAKSVLCAGCHGQNGEGQVMPDGQPDMPLLAGQIPGYFIKSMTDYRTDKRLDPMMNAISKGLTYVDIENLAAYYASLSTP